MKKVMSIKKYFAQNLANFFFLFSLIKNNHVFLNETP